MKDQDQTHRIHLPKATKTGTTICGIVFKDGVILGADTRSTNGTIVAEKKCRKIHYISKNIRCCGAGTAADTSNVTRMVASDLELHGLEADNDVVPVVMAKTILKRYLYQYQGHVSAALVYGGVDNDGPHLGVVDPHGYTDDTPFASMGSGSLAAMSVLESRYKKNLSLEEGKKLVTEAIAAGVFNDLGSGSNIDLCIITKEKTEMLSSKVVNFKAPREGNYKYPIGSTKVLKSTRIPIEIVSEITQTEEPMEE